MFHTHAVVFPPFLSRNKRMFAAGNRFADDAANRFSREIGIRKYNHAPLLLREANAFDKVFGNSGTAGFYRIGLHGSLNGNRIGTAFHNDDFLNQVDSSKSGSGMRAL